MLVTLLFACFTLGFFLGISRTGPAVTVSVDSSLRTVPEPSAPVMVQKETSYADSVFPVNINTAGKELLTTLPGVGDVLAQRILDHRSLHGPFARVMDLMNVEGIGEKTMEQLLDYITTGG